MCLEFHTHIRQTVVVPLWKNNNRVLTKTFASVPKENFPSMITRLMGDEHRNTDKKFYQSVQKSPTRNKKRKIMAVAKLFALNVSAKKRKAFSKRFALHANAKILL